MERNGNQNFPPVTLCRSGCGFYGNAQFEGMCSKCYKDALKRKNQNPSTVSGRASPSVSSVEVSSSSVATLTSVTASFSEASVRTGTPTIPSLSSTPQEKEAEKSEVGATAGGSDAKAEESPSPADDAKEKKPKKNRCFSCKKKVGLTGFLCRCEGLFCSLHRYSDKHSCTFDYKEMAQEQIRKNNPVVVGDKIQKI